MCCAVSHEPVDILAFPFVCDLPLKFHMYQMNFNNNACTAHAVLKATIPIVVLQSNHKLVNRGFPVPKPRAPSRLGLPPLQIAPPPPTHPNPNTLSQIAIPSAAYADPEDDIDIVSLSAEDVAADAAIRQQALQLQLLPCGWPSGNNTVSALSATAVTAGAVTPTAVCATVYH